MPELPDVETYRRRLEDRGLDRTIRAVDVLRREVLEDDVGTGELEDVLVGHQLLETRRHGKHLFARSGGGAWLAFHFGMTAELVPYEAGEDAPEYERLRIAFEGPARLAFTCPRMLGDVGMTHDPAAYCEAKGLGPDALAIDEDAFLAYLERRSGMIKTALMDQRGLAGIGNVYSDEILFQRRIHPATPIADLDRDARRALHACLRDVLTTAIEAGAEPDAMPEGFLLRRREPGADCPACDGSVERIKISGRSAYLCPACQGA